MITSLGPTQSRESNGDILSFRIAKRVLKSFGLAVAMCLIAIAAQADDQKCKGSPNVVGPCFTVHGRVHASNGIPIWLWIVGTRRQLIPNGVPASVETLLDLDDVQTSIVVYGDYEVCPLEKERPGSARSVCIEKAEHLKAFTRDGKPVMAPK